MALKCGLIYWGCKMLNYVSSQSFHTLNHWQTGKTGSGYLTSLDMILRIVKTPGGSVYSDCPALTDENVNTNHIWGQYGNPYVSPFNAAVYNRGYWNYLQLTYSNILDENTAQDGVPGYGYYASNDNTGINLAKQGGIISGALYNSDMAYSPYLLNSSGNDEYGASWRAEWKPGELKKSVYDVYKMGESDLIERISIEQAKQLKLATIRKLSYVTGSLYWVGKIYYGHSNSDTVAIADATFTPLYVFSINSYVTISGTHASYIYELVYNGEYSE